MKRADRNQQGEPKTHMGIAGITDTDIEEASWMDDVGKAIRYLQEIAELGQNDLGGKILNETKWRDTTARVKLLHQWLAYIQKSQGAQLSETVQRESVMPNHATLVPDQPVPDQPANVTVYVAIDDLNRNGRAWLEMDEKTVIDNLIAGQYERPVRIVAFNTAEGWARDMTEDIAGALVEEARNNCRELSSSARTFYVWHIGKDVPVDVA